MSENKPAAVVVTNLYKSFKLPHEQHSGIKQVVVNFANRKNGYEEQQVLEDVSFEIKKGEFFGIVGRNGSGKSTLLKLLAGIYTPDKGHVQVNGSLTPFIELGVGFNPELTGRENVFMNGALLGFSNKEMHTMYDDIVEFAELERFMDQKLKNYSSGMQVRLAFSIAIRANSDILLIDEVLAVGDAAFQTKCFEYFMELKKAKKTVILVSHDRGSLEKFCTNGILIDNGKIIPTTSLNDVLDKYTDIVLGQMKDGEKLSTENSKDKEPETVSIERIKIISDNNEATTKLHYGEKYKLELDLKFLEATTNAIAGITIWKKDVEEAVYAANNLTESAGNLGAISTGETVTLKLDVPHVLNNGDYTIEVGVANEAATVYLLQNKHALRFRIFGSRNPHSMIATKKNMVIDKEGA